jgi:predicted dehydrogenase
MEPISYMGWQIASRSGIDLSYAGQMVFPGGICAHIHSSFQSPYNPFFEITGSEGRLLVPQPWKPSERSSILIEREGRVKMEQFRSKELYIWEVTDMEHAVLDGKPPRISLKDSRGNVAAILGLLEAARTKSVVT